MQEKNTLKKTYKNSIKFPMVPFITKLCPCFTKWNTPFKSNTLRASKASSQTLQVCPLEWKCSICFL